MGSIVPAVIFLLLLLLLSSIPGDGFRVDLSHPAAQLKAAGASQREAIRALVAKSHARARWIAAHIGNSSSAAVTQSRKLATTAASTTREDFQSPLRPDGGGYTMEILVGTPAKKFKALADTGSDLVWIQSMPCNSGCSSGSVFDPHSSSTYRDVDCSSQLCAELPGSCQASRACQYNYAYGSGATTGVLGKDTIAMGSSPKFSAFTVGCGFANDGFDGVDGLVGLGQGSVSLTSQLAAAIDRKFSYCLVDINSASQSSPLYFGQSAALNGAGVQSTRIVPSQAYPTYYLLDVTGVTVNGRSMGAPGTTIIDSGTTLTYLPDALYQRLVARMTEHVTLPRVDGSSVGLDLCYDTSGSDDFEFPALTIKLEGAKLSPPAGNYFLALDEGGNTVCLALGSANGMPVSIIGNVMQQGYHILYDRGNSALSFVKEKCETLK